MGQISRLSRNMQQRHLLGASNKEDCLEEVDETTFYFSDTDIPKTTSSAGWSSV